MSACVRVRCRFSTIFIPERVAFSVAIHIQPERFHRHILQQFALPPLCVCVLCRFSTIFIPELVAFSVAMHMTYLPTPGPLPAEFATVGTTLMTMFKLMLGLSDVDVLYEAPEQWLAILLFVLYVLLTYSLMLNALIALMSNTCSIVSQNRVT